MTARATCRRDASPKRRRSGDEMDPIFSIHSRFYKTKEEFDEKTLYRFKGRIRRAGELVDDARAEKIRFPAVVVDSWYAHSSRRIASLHAKEITLVVEAETNRCISVHPPVKRKRCFLQRSASMTSVVGSRT